MNRSSCADPTPRRANEFPEEIGFGDKPLRRRRDPTRWKAWRCRLLTKSPTWREHKNGEEEQHPNARWRAVVVHNTRMRQLPVQPQLPESTDRSRSVWWRDVANGDMVDNK